MPTNKETDAAMRVAERIAEIMDEYFAELHALGQNPMEAIFNSHLPLFSSIKASRTIIKHMFGSDALEHFDRMIDKIKIDEEAH